MLPPAEIIFFNRAKVVLKLPALIGFNETMTFKGKATKKGGMGDLERIHIKEVLQQTQLRRMRNSLFCAAHTHTRRQREERDEGRREVRKQVRTKEFT